MDYKLNQYSQRLQDESAKRQEKIQENAQVYYNRYPGEKWTDNEEDPVLRLEKQRAVQLDRLDMLEEELDHPELKEIEQNKVNRQIQIPKKMGYFAKKRRRRQLSNIKKSVNKTTNFIQETYLNHSIARANKQITVKEQETMLSKELEAIKAEYNLAINILDCRGIKAESIEGQRVRSNFEKRLGEKNLELAKLYPENSQECISYFKNYTTYKSKAEKMERDLIHRENTVETLKQIRKFSGDERHAVTAYTGARYKRINPALREGDIESLGKEDKKICRNLKNAMDKCSLPNTLTVYRGTSEEVLGEKLINQLNASGDPYCLVGQTIKEEAFMSTTLKEDVVKQRFNSGRVRLIITAQKGSKGLDIGELSHQPESEVLFQAGQKMLITKAQYAEGLQLHVMLGDNEESGGVKHG